MGRTQFTCTHELETSDLIGLQVGCGDRPEIWGFAGAGQRQISGPNEMEEQCCVEGDWGPS